MFIRNKLGRISAIAIIISFSSISQAELKVEYTLSDANTGTATNTGALGASMNGSISGGTIILSPFSPDNQALELGGNPGNGISMPNGYDFGAAFTVEMLARLDTLQGSDNMLFDDFGGPGVLLLVNTSTQQLQLKATTAINGNVILVSPDVFPLNQWHHIAGVYDGLVLKLYLDGVLVASESASGITQNHPLVTPNIGIESNEVAFPWLGAIDDFRLHDTALPIGGFNDGNPVPNGDVGPKDLIIELINSVIALNLKKGISNALDAKLDNSIRALEDTNSANDIAAVNMLYAFMGHVEAQRGAHINDLEADALIADAQVIIDLLNMQ